MTRPLLQTRQLASPCYGNHLYLGESMRRLIVVSVLLTAGCAVPRPEVGGAPVPASTAAMADEAAIRAVRAASNAAIALSRCKFYGDRLAGTHILFDG